MPAHNIIVDYLTAPAYSARSAVERAKEDLPGGRHSLDSLAGERTRRREVTVNTSSQYWRIRFVVSRSLAGPSGLLSFPKAAMPNDASLVAAAQFQVEQRRLRILSPLPMETFLKKSVWNDLTYALLDQCFRQFK